MNPWNAQRYEAGHSYVWRFGGDLLELLAPHSGERILDLGCGTGQLTAQIAASGARVVGLDHSAAMLDQARRNYPELEFIEGDAATFRFSQSFDAVFSNAVLHWVKNGEAAVESISAALRPGGRFIAEFGGNGNIASILHAIAAVFGPDAEQRCPWWYPGIAEYASLLERHGLEVRQASLFDRPTPIEGENAMADWITMFCGAYFRDLPEHRVKECTLELVERLRPNLYNAGTWTLDYRRLRIAAVKQ